MRAIAMLATALLFACPAPASAEVDCGNAMNTVEMNECADKAFLEADRALNAAYKAALAGIAKDNGEASEAKKWEAALRSSQRAWIAFRDAECKGLVAMEWSGGTGATSAILGCMTQMTQERTKALEERFAKPGGPARVP
jgi:uncharacterized protein YecT (DUF1311 family)